MGDGKTVLAIILGGFTGVDVVHISALALKRYGCTRSTFLTPPYVFTGEEHCWDFVSGDPAKDFLACGEEGFRCFFLKKEAHTIEGLKIRVWDATIMTGMASGVLDAAMAKCEESVIAVEDKTPSGRKPPTPSSMSISAAWRTSTSRSRHCSHTVSTHC